jgi:hypothetical protein
MMVSQDSLPGKSFKELYIFYPMLVALRLSRNFGKGVLLYAGLEICRGQAAIVIDN